MDQESMEACTVYFMRSIIWKVVTVGQMWTYFQLQYHTILNPAKPK